MKWEYTSKKRQWYFPDQPMKEEEDMREEIELLNQMGQEGWELIQLRTAGDYDFYMFKRPVQATFQTTISAFMPMTDHIHDYSDGEEICRVCGERRPWPNPFGGYAKGKEARG